MEQSVKVVVIEFLPVMADIFKTTLEGISNVEVVGLAKDYMIGNELINQLHPDFLICDYNPQCLDCLEVLASLRANHLDMGIIVITSIDISEHIGRLMELKINGVIDKVSTINNLRASLKCALNNQFVVPNSYLPELLAGSRSTCKAPLTIQDINIMKMVLEDKTRKQIASNISVSARSIDNYLKNIYRKLGCSNRMEAVGIFARSNFR
jgi:DNA-binding NarL/FixJ family response regulator